MSYVTDFQWHQSKYVLGYIKPSLKIWAIFYIDFLIRPDFLCFFGHFELFQPPISTFWLWGVVQTLILHELGSNLFNKANSWSNKSLKLNLSKKIYFYYAQWAAKVRTLNRKTYFFHHSPTLAHFFLKFWQLKKK